ncbi:hypothetical protein B0A48_18113 [Cryoendolithus antarcticus]|uniref:NB-ARC domain-containing protein n=1 Tax=Cryoendolithus antarcticus TaxID=1507870 RepID=A0A1V8S9E4_9PEZI|nr:hypothetical protein B0A48_18113 [Cryoendolithus antarcticus]
MLARSWSLLGVNAEIFDEVQSNNMSLRQTHASFLSFLEGRSVRIGNFFELRATAHLPFYATILVRQRDATFDSDSGEVLNVSLPTDHSGLNKFASRYTPGYYQIRNALVDILQDTYDMDAEAARMRYVVPFTTSEAFTDRLTLTAQLEHAMDKSHSIHVRKYAAAITSAGAMGKTQLALNFAEKHRDDYDTVLWIDASSAASVKTSFSRCCQALDMPSAIRGDYTANLGSSPEVTALLVWLESRTAPDQAWLMIVDNADDFGWGIRDVMLRLSPLTRGTVVVTSRNEHCTDLLSDMPIMMTVESMSDHEALDLLLHACRWSGHRHGNSTQIQSPESNSVASETLELVDHERNKSSNMKHEREVIEIAGDICYRLDNYPLAIDLAAANIRNASKRTSMFEAMAQYYLDYSRHRDDLLINEEFHSLSSSRQSVWTVWDTSFASISEMTSGFKCPPMNLLCMLSIFDSSAIQRETFEQASAGCKEVCEQLKPGASDTLPSWLRCLLGVDSNGKWDDCWYRRCMAVLERYHLVQGHVADRDGHTMHSMIQWRTSMDCQDPIWMQWYVIFMASACYNAASASEDISVRPLLLAHVPTKYIRPALASFSVTGIDFVYLHIGKVWELEGGYPEARHHYLQITRYINPALVSSLELSIEQRFYNLNLYLAGISRLASVHIKMCNFPRARSLLEQLLSYYLEEWGPTHSSTLHTQLNLGQCLLASKDYANALDLIYEAHEGFQSVSGESDVETVASGVSSAAALREVGSYDAASAYGRKMVELRTRTLGPKHSDTLDAMSEVAITYTRQGRLVEATEIAEEVYKLQETVSPFALKSATRLATLYHSQNRFAEAEAIGNTVLTDTDRLLRQRQSRDSAMAIVELGCLLIESKHGEPLLLRARAMLVLMGNIGGDLYTEIDAALDRRRARLRREASEQS